MDMIEKVARALALAHGSHITGPSRHRASDEFGWDIGHQYMQKYIDKHWKDHAHAARFAIETMRNELDTYLKHDEEGVVQWLDAILSAG